MTAVSGDVSILWGKQTTRLLSIRLPISVRLSIISVLGRRDVPYTIKMMEGQNDRVEGHNTRNCPMNNTIMRTFHQGLSMKVWISLM